MNVRNVIVGFLLSFIFLELAAPALQFLFDQNIETLVILSEKDTEEEENVKNQKINSSIIFENFTSEIIFTSKIIAPNCLYQSIPLDLNYPPPKI